LAPIDGIHGSFSSNWKPSWPGASRHQSGIDTTNSTAAATVPQSRADRSAPRGMIASSAAAASGKKIRNDSQGIGGNVTS